MFDSHGRKIGRVKEQWQCPKTGDVLTVYENFRDHKEVPHKATQDDWHVAHPDSVKLEYKTGQFNR